MNYEKMINAEKLLRSSSDYLQKLNDSLGAVIFTVKIPERVIEYVNCAVESVFGYKPDECIGKETKMLYLAVEKYHDFGRLLKSAIKEGKNKLREEMLFKRKDGKIIPCEVTTTFLKEDEKIVRVISILHDITERRKAEVREKLDVFMANFSRSCRDFAELKPVLELVTAGLAEQLDVSRASVWLLDDSGNLVCQKLYEHPKSVYSEGMVLYSKNYPNYIKAILNDNPIDVHDARTDPRTSEFLNNYLLPLNIFSLLDTPIKVKGKVSGVLCLEQTSYSRHWQKYEIDFANTITAQLSNAIDRITERKKIEGELINAQKLESIGVLAGGIAHDFNNSLQAILSGITAAKLYINPEDEVYKRLTNVEKVAIQSKGLSQQLLTFSRGGDPIKKFISAYELIQDSANFALSGSNVRCELDLPDCRCLVEVDKGQINQVFNNLFINAVHAMPEGGIIKVKAENTNIGAKGSLPLKEGEYVRITIADKGAGISKEHLQKIFDPFFTTKQEGSGLGLATTYSIIKKHDGHITVKSKMGIGTTFHIYLPSSQKEIPTENVPGKAEEKAVGETPFMSKGKILFMDDEALIRLSTSDLLKRLKYEVEEARDSSEAIELYKKAFESDKPFDAVIMDLTIVGDMGGEVAIRKLLGIDPNVKAIISSGHTNNPIMANFRKYGFKEVLTKPYEINELYENIAKSNYEKRNDVKK